MDNPPFDNAPGADRCEYVKQSKRKQQFSFKKENAPLAGCFTRGVCIRGRRFFTFNGMDWDEEQHLHPDERFLTMVSSAIEPVESLGNYFDTANSTLNPHNRGYTFYVYGTLPLIVAVSSLGESLEMAGYGDIHLVGRALSATVDLLTVLLVFLTGERLYDRRVGVWAAAFSAVAVLQFNNLIFIPSILLPAFL